MHKKTGLAWSAVVVPVLIAAGCASLPDEATTRQIAEGMVKTGFSATPEHAKRLVQDKSQQMCSKIGDARLTPGEADEVLKLARASLKYPQSGKLVGDWKVGAKLAYNGSGTRISGGKLEKAKENGALCSNCHVLAPKEFNVGNIGPSLAGYGAQRGNSDAIVKYTYEKLYNAWAYFPCSNMPRLGHNGHLTPEQITHVVAYLTDPASPVNRK